MNSSSIHPFAGMDVASLLEMRVKTRADHPFLIWQPFDADTKRWTYAEFDHVARQAAAGLIARGVKFGDMVLIHLDNCPELLIAWFACAKIGAVAVTTNTRSAADEVEYFSDHCGAVGAITQPKYAELVAGSAHGVRWLAVTDNDAGEVPEAGLPDRASSFDSLLDAAENLPCREVDPAAPMAVFYTSGTTARPKGVLLTHANMLWGAKINGEQQRMHPSDIAMVYLPLFHINAQAYSIFPSLWVGGTVVLQPRFSASRFWDVATSQNCSWASMVTFCIKVLSEMDVPPNSFRLWGNAKCDQPTDPYFGIKTLGWFGMTETVAHPLCGDPHQPNKPMSMGRVVPGYEIAVVDEGGNQLPPGGEGELRIGGQRGVSLFKEYLNNAEATAESFDDKGRFKTGDRVTYDEEGFFDYLDRLKDMLKVGGENVGASEIERVISAISDVAAAAVVGKPDELRGELPVAFVTAAEDAAERDGLADAVLAECRQKLADFKVPTEVRIVDDLPRGNLEKINKVELRRWLDN